MFIHYFKPSRQLNRIMIEGNNKSNDIVKPTHLLVISLSGNLLIAKVLTMLNTGNMPIKVVNTIVLINSNSIF